MDVWEVPCSSCSGLDKGFLMDVGPKHAKRKSFSIPKVQDSHFDPSLGCIFKTVSHTSVTLIKSCENACDFLKNRERLSFSGVLHLVRLTYIKR